MSRWIHVSERVPEWKQRVLYVGKKDQRINVGSYRGEGAKGAQFFMNGNRLDTSDWWMELPELPKEEQ